MSQLLWIRRTALSISHPTGAASSSDGLKLVACGDGAGSPYDYIYTSVDRGATWSHTSLKLPWQAVASSADGVMLAAVESIAGQGDGYVYLSTNRGASWSQSSLDSGASLLTGIACSSDGTKLVACINSGLIWRSYDAGATWNPLISAGSRAWIAIASSADGTVLIAAVNSGNLYVSTDSGSTWNSVLGNFGWSCVASSFDGTKLFAGTTGEKIHVSTDSGSTWNAYGAVSTWRSIACSSDGTKVIAVGSDVRTSVDSGVNWEIQTQLVTSGYAVTSSANGINLMNVTTSQTYVSPSEIFGNNV
jgi:hypothetical protein